MHIALITDGIWPYVLGGMQKHSFYLCKYLAQQKVNIDLVHFNSSNYDISKLEFFSEEERKYIHSIVIDFPTGSGLPGHYIRKSYQHSQLIFEVLKDKIPTYDFIYTKGFTGWYLMKQKKAGAIACCKIGVKFHGYEMFQRAPDFKTKLQHLLLLRKPVREISLMADIVFSYGGKITDIIKQIGVSTNHIFEIPSGVETENIASKITEHHSPTRFLFLGRYERRKGIEELNEAIRLLPKEKFEFHFVGPIPIAKQISDSRVKYYGEVRDKNQLTNIVQSCDILVCPSWSEGMPNVILEAMANGLSVIATDVGATNVLVNNSCGWLINNSSPEKISKTIKTALSVDSQGLESRKQNALNRIREQFTWDKLILIFHKRIAKL